LITIIGLGGVGRQSRASQPFRPEGPEQWFLKAEVDFPIRVFRYRIRSWRVSLASLHDFYQLVGKHTLET
jgi:hypothetical protein